MTRWTYPGPILGFGKLFAVGGGYPMPSKKNLRKEYAALRRGHPLLNVVVRGWKYLSENERREFTYRVAFAVDRAGRYWQLIDPVSAPLIIGEG